MLKKAFFNALSVNGSTSALTARLGRSSTLASPRSTLMWHVEFLGTPGLLVDAIEYTKNLNAVSSIATGPKVDVGCFFHLSTDQHHHQDSLSNRHP